MASKNLPSIPPQLADAVIFPLINYSKMPAWSYELDEAGNIIKHDKELKTDTDEVKVAKRLRKRSWKHWEWQLDTTKFLPYMRRKELTGYGVDCGRSGLVVLDLDIKDDYSGVDSFKRLMKERGGTMPPTFAVQTGSGGWHFYFKAPEDFTVINCHGKLTYDAEGTEQILGVDIKGMGGLVVGPNTRAKRGVPRDVSPWSDMSSYKTTSYRIQPKTKDAPIADIPEWLLEVLKEHAARKDAKAATQVDPADFTPQDDDFLFASSERRFKEITDKFLASREPGYEGKKYPLYDAARDAAKAGVKYERAWETLLQMRGNTPDNARQVDNGWTSGRSSLEHWATENKVSLEKKAKRNHFNKDSSDPREGHAYYTNSHIVKRVEEALAPTLRYVQEMRSYIRYNPVTGVWDKKDTSYGLTVVADFLQEEYDAIAGDEDLSNKAKLQALTLLSASTCSHAEKFLRARTTMPVALLNTHREKVVCANGVFDVSTGKLGPFDASLYETRTTGRSYIPGLIHPDVDLLLQAVQEDSLSWFQEQLGKALTGYQSTHDFILFLYGPRAGNGKSTILEMMTATAGGYGTDIDRDALQKHSGANFGMAAYEYARQAYIEELPDRFLSGPTVKTLVNQRTIKVERKFEQSRTIAFEANTFITANTLPSVSETDDGMWRRLRVLRFDKKFVETEAELIHPNTFLASPRLSDLSQLPAEAFDAFLTWRLEGAVRWYARKRVEAPLPPSVAMATAEFRGDTDIFMAWMGERVNFTIGTGKAKNTLTSDAYDCFEEWCKENGHTPVTRKTFRQRFENHDTYLRNGVTRVKGDATVSKTIHAEWTPRPPAHMRFGEYNTVEAYNMAFTRKGDGVRERYLNMSLRGWNEELPEDSTPEAAALDASLKLPTSSDSDADYMNS